MKPLRAAIFVPASLLLASVASGQEIGNGIAALNDTVRNANTVLSGVVSGEPALVSGGTSQLASDLVADLADGSPFEGAAQQGVTAAQPLVSTVETPLVEALSGPAASLAEAARPLTSIYSFSPLLSGGIPLVDGERVILLEDRLGIGATLRSQGVPVDALNRLIKVDVLGPGDNDGGAVLIPLSGGVPGAGLPTQGLSALPVGALPLPGGAPGAGELPIDALPVPGSSDIPVGLGALTGTGAPGIPVSDIPLPAGTLDPTAVTALTSGASLPGL